VELDVNRAFVHYPQRVFTPAVQCFFIHTKAAFLDTNEAEEALRRQQLSDLIVCVLRQHSYLHYFQGFHDVCQVFLLVLEPDVQPPAVARLCATRIRDFMLPTMEPALSQLALLPQILRAADPKLSKHLELLPPHFAIADTLTMYAHNVTSLGVIARMFDVLLALPPAFTLYLFAAIIRSRREELFAEDDDAVLHAILSKLPLDLDLDALIAAAVRLYRTHPPEDLPAWRRLSPYSVLKTSPSTRAAAAQSLEECEGIFDQQVQRMKWEAERRKQLELARALWRRYRGPIKMLGFAIGMASVAVWMRRSGWSLAHMTSFMRLLQR
jgi:TBC1 domain family member 20